MRRDALEAAEKARLEAVGRLAVSEAECHRLREDLAAARAEMKAALDAAEKERQRLTDRLLMQAGQPPLYTENPPVPTAATPEYDVKDLAKARALPAAGVTFSGVHAAAREAMANGTFDIDRARVRR